MITGPRCTAERSGDRTSSVVINFGQSEATLETLPKIDIKLEIRRNSDGTIATDVWEGWEYNTYWWEEGNASCDCNRELFFCRALKLPEPDETECGDGKYSVRLSDNNTGEELYSEF